MGGSLLFVVSALLLLVAAIVARSRAAVLPRGLVVEYVPVLGSSVVDDAILAGRERRAVAAGLIDLVVRGRVRLLTEDGTSHKSIAVQIVDPEDLTDDERRLLDCVCGADTPSGASRRLSRDRREVARRVRGYVESRARQLRRDGLLAGHHPGRAIIRWSSAVLLTITVLFLASAPGPGDFGFGVLAVLLLIAALVVVPAGRRRRFGAVADSRRAHLDGMRQYLVRAEAERLRVLQSPAGSIQNAGDAVSRFALNERLLPYAMVFGVEAAWLGTLRVEYDELGETSGAAVATVGDQLMQVLDASLVLEGLANIVFGAGHALDAAGAVIDGLP